MFEYKSIKKNWNLSFWTKLKAKLRMKLTLTSHSCQSWIFNRIQLWFALIISKLLLIKCYNNVIIFQGLLTFVNCWDVKWSTKVQDFFTYGKLLALVTIIITGVVQLCYGHVEHFNFNNSEVDVTKIALSFYSGLFAYNGW